MQSRQFETSGTGRSAPIGGQAGRSQVLRPIVANRPSVARPTSVPESVEKNKRRKAGAESRSWGAYVVRVLAVSAIFVLCAAAVTGYWGYRRARAIESTYHQVSADVQGLQSLTSANFSSFTPADADRVHGQFVQLQVDVNSLDVETHVPARLEPLVLKIPYVGPRYTAGKQVIQVAQLLANSGVQASAIGQQALTAYKTTGLASSEAPSGQTWLDVIDQQMPQIIQVRDQINEALQLRSQIDESVLPVGARTKLGKLDQLASSHNLNNLIDVQLPALQAAFGADGPARYLVLIQNPSELRPSGGFPGTIALVTFDRGQLRSYEFYDVYDLNEAYTTAPHDAVQQPWPLSKYAPSPELSILDASWWSDFPTSGATIMKMYSTTGWPSIRGVVAIDPAVVGAMLKLTGPMTIDVDGEMRTITSENVHDEIERQRRLARAGEKTEDVHKQVVAIIGKQLIDQFKGGDRQTVLNMVDAIKQTAQSRDLQIYSSDSTLQAMMEKHGWAGRLVPNPSQPTVAVTFANVAFGKSSELMDPRYTVTLGDVSNGMQSAQLKIDMTHTGSPDDDPFYSGFQRWWIDVTLPDGSTVTRSNIADVTNPDEPNGGSYEVPLMPGASATLTINFEMPVSDSLTIRRQPGVHTAQVSVVDSNCASASNSQPLNQDLVYDLNASCTGP